MQLNRLGKIEEETTLTDLDQLEHDLEHDIEDDVNSAAPSPRVNASSIRCCVLKNPSARGMRTASNSCACIRTRSRKRPPHPSCNPPEPYIYKNRF